MVVWVFNAAKQHRIHSRHREPQYPQRMHGAFGQEMNELLVFTLEFDGIIPRRRWELLAIQNQLWEWARGAWCREEAKWVKVD